MGQRLELQKRLEEILGSKNVYYQPPESVKMKYPAIEYHLGPSDTRYANNMPYTFTKRYELTLIYTDPDIDLIEELAYAFPMISHDRHYAVDNLYHDVFSLYY